MGLGERKDLLYVENGSGFGGTSALYGEDRNELSLQWDRGAWGGVEGRERDRNYPRLCNHVLTRLNTVNSDSESHGCECLSVTAFSTNYRVNPLSPEKLPPFSPRETCAASSEWEYGCEESASSPVIRNVVVLAREAGASISHVGEVQSFCVWEFLELSQVHLFSLNSRNSLQSQTEMICGLIVLRN